MAGWLVGWLGEETLLQLKLRTETEAEPEAIAMPLCSAERRQSGDCGCIYRVLWLYECCCPEFPVPSSQFPIPGSMLQLAYYICTSGGTGFPSTGYCRCDSPAVFTHWPCHFSTCFQCFFRW